MSDEILKHLMRIYCVIFIVWGTALLIVPNLFMDILNLEHLQGYFWNILGFGLLLFLAMISFQASKEQDLIKFITLYKFASAITYFSFGIGLFNLGLILAGCVDLGMGLVIIICKKL